MQPIAIMSFLWILGVAAFVALMVYRGHLTQHETDELFLSDGDAQHESYRHREHDEIVSKVNKMRPYIQVSGGFAALMTVAIIGLEVSRLISTL